MPATKGQDRRSSRIRAAAFIGCVLVTVPLAFVAYQAVQTLHELTRVERERDHWQRPSDVLNALNLRPGSIVADLGSGSGYFSLKLAPMVGARGRVLATDIRLLSLSFLWIRAQRLPHRNVTVIHGEVDNPHLPSGTLDAVLIANTYHELTHPTPILAAVFRSLKPGGRLVVLDRGPRSHGSASGETLSQHHELALDAVADEIRQAGFQTIGRDDHFIDLTGEDHIWWLLIATRP